MDLSRELLQQGFDRIIAAGGDGTINEVANGFLQNDAAIRPEAALAILPLGTGGDYRRTLGIPADLDKAIEILDIGKARSVDIGKAMFRGHDGVRRERYFTNVVSFGMGGEVAARSRNFLSPLGGQAAFLYATVSVFFSYHPKHVRLKLDGAAETPPFRIMNIAVGNGCFHGGGMKICPTAALDDGIFEVTVIEHIGALELIRDVKVLYSDDIYSHPKVKHLRARRIAAESQERTSIEVDGEPLGTLPLEISVLPAAIQVIAPQRSR